MSAEMGMSLLLYIGAVHVAAAVFLVPYVAIEKGRPGILWAISALVFSPLLALVALAALPRGTAREPASPFEAELRDR